MSEQVNCEGAGGVSGRNPTEETGPVEDWENDDWENDLCLLPAECQEEVTEQPAPKQHQQQQHICECCEKGFPDANALEQHQKSCSDCLVAFRKLGVSERQIFEAVDALFFRNPELRNKLKIALFSVLKNEHYTYRCNHSRWLLFWLTKLGLICLEKDTTNLTDFQSILKPNLEESLRLSKKYNWQTAPAINSWIDVDKIKSLLQIRKVDRLEQFVLLESVAEFNAARQEEEQRTHTQKRKTVAKTPQDKKVEVAKKEKAQGLKARISELHCKVPIAEECDLYERLIRLLEAIEAQRAQFNSPIRPSGSKFDFGTELLRDDKHIDELIVFLEQMTQAIEQMQDSNKKFADCWSNFWQMAKTIPPIMFNNPLDIVRQRLLEEKEKLKSPQKKKLVVELGQLMKSKEAKDDTKLLHSLKGCGFLEECQLFFKQ